MARVALAEHALVDIVQRSGVVFFEWELGRGLTFVSESARDLLGVTDAALGAEPLIGDRLLQPAFRRYLTPLWVAASRESTPVARAEIPCQTAGGGALWFEARVVPQYAKDGRLHALLGFAVDATALVNGRADADEARRRYRLIFEAAPVPMVLVDPRTMRLTDVNDRGCRLLGGDEEELVGTLATEHVVPEERERVEAYFKSGTGEAGVRMVPRTFLRRRGGDRFPAQIAAVNMWLDGAPRRLAVLRALSDTESAEETLKTMRRAAEATDEAVFILDGEKRIVFANEGTAALLRRPMDELHGLNPALFVEAAWVDEWARALAMTEAGWLWRGVVVFAAPGAPPSELDVELVPVQSPLGLVTHLVAVVRPPSATPLDDSMRWSNASSSTLMLALLSRYVENALSSSRNRLGILATSGAVATESRTEVLGCTFQIDCAIEFTRFMRELHGNIAAAQPAGRAEPPGDLVPILRDVVQTVRLVNPIDEVPQAGSSPLASAPVAEPTMAREVLLGVLYHAAGRATDCGGRAQVALESTVFDSKQAFWVRISVPALTDPSGPASSEVGLAICRELVEGAGGVLTVEERAGGAEGPRTEYGVLLPAA